MATLVKSPQIGQRIHKARVSKGLSQEKLAAAMGISRLTVIRWESGVNPPTTENAEKLAALLDRQASWFRPARRRDGAPAKAA